ncbi:transcriptional regulator [Candidatus Saccharibacteria bacterium]|jgi:predicted transcriptional regulator|nr:transcriptional regulator [Candidatus Saccharibacteria bacterium]MBP7834713.1 transcriptional regulator [Candidatus Saccharibacteria bacterium]
MVEQLFGSKTRVKLLQLFCQNPNRSFYVREITRKIDEQINSVRRELANLLSIGIITSDNSNNKLYYEVNQDYEYYDALANMFAGKKMKAKKTTKPKQQKADEPSVADKTDIEDEVLIVEVEESTNPIAEVIKKAGNVRLAVITGQFTLDNKSGVDIVVVGDINETNLENAISELEVQEKKDLRYVTFDSNEFIYRKQVNDRFVSDLKVAKKVVLIDKDNLL